MTGVGYELIAADGRVLRLDSGQVQIDSTGPLGNPEINYVQQQAYYQDGVSVTAFNAMPRQLNLTFVYGKEGYTTDNLTALWTLRNRILQFVNAYAAPLTFRVTRQDNSIRELRKVYPTPGALFETGAPVNRVNIEPVTFTAFDPIWYDGATFNSGALTGTTDTELVYPKTYPITYGAAGTLITTGALSYAGTWRVYPKLTITGPYNTLTIVNSATGATIQFFISLPAGQSRVIDMSDPVNGFSVTSGAGVNAWSELTVNSNLTDFYIDAFTTPTITANAAGGGVATTMTVEYTARYVGI